MMQIVQELCKRPGLNGTCFDMPTIFIPNPNKVIKTLLVCISQQLLYTKQISHTKAYIFMLDYLSFQPVRCVNQIEEVCKDIEKTIEQTIQNTLNHLEKDCDEIGQKVDEAIATDNSARSHNLRARGKGCVVELCYR